MSISFLSPLNLQECISRLEEARKKEINLLRWSVSGRTFILRQNHARSSSHIRGELTETHQGTVINCSIETDQTTNMLSSLWLMAALPLFTCVALGLLLNGFLNGFSKELLLIFLIVVSIPAFSLLQRQLGIRRAERSQKEMFDFLQKVLDAKPRLP